MNEPLTLKQDRSFGVGYLVCNVLKLLYTEKKIIAKNVLVDSIRNVLKSLMVIPRQEREQKTVLILYYTLLAD